MNATGWILNRFRTVIFFVGILNFFEIIINFYSLPLVMKLGGALQQQMR